jgi:hypothetical protein
MRSAPCASSSATGCLRDLRRGWRFNNPNLDQLNLLSIAYRGWMNSRQSPLCLPNNPVLACISPEQRATLASMLFDSMRRSLCLETRYLDPVEQDKAKATAHQYLNERWAFAADENLETAKYLILTKRPEYRGKPRTDLIPGGSRSRLLKDIKTAKFWKDSAAAAQVATWKDPQWVELLEKLLLTAKDYGFVQPPVEVDSQTAGWRLNASCMDWMLVDEQQALDDGKHNQFFRSLYLAVAQTLRQQGHALFDFEAQEHTAQVDASRRQLLEQRFRYTEKDRKDWLANPVHEAPLERLPVMFCSPTMELGVDISALNTVYLRNVPPTPANYAQRSGRAGRSGQQALVITYCAALSPHDQWFFHHATEMVHGIVKPPTLDLANRDLVESHLHAVWMAAAQVQLDTSIAPLLDLEKPDKPLQPALREKLAAPEVTARALQARRASWPNWPPCWLAAAGFRPTRLTIPCGARQTTSAPPSSAGACWWTPPASRWTWPTRWSKATPPATPKSKTPSAATVTPPGNTRYCSSRATARTLTSTPTATWPARAFCPATTFRAASHGLDTCQGRHRSQRQGRRRQHGQPPALSGVV